LPRLPLARDQGDEPQQVFNPEMRSSRRHHLESAGRRDTRPRRWQALERVCFIEVVDPVLAPSEAPIYQPELTPTQRMERMSNLEELRCIDQLGCS